MLQGPPATANKPLWDEIDWRATVQVVLLHLACLFAFWTGVSWIAIFVCFACYTIRMFGVSAGYHRYFAHRSYSTGRIFQLFLGILATMSYGRGPLWWAAHHRYHHKQSDTKDDIHSPFQNGFFYSHVGWILLVKNRATDGKRVQNLLKFPELVWLDNYYPVPPILLGISLFALGVILKRGLPGLGTSGPQMLVWGFLISTVLLYHATFTLTSLTHMYGSHRFEVGDQSRNNFLLAIITLGEGWHNNHHFCPSSERQGFLWWEIDITHYVLTGLSWLGIVRDLRGPEKQLAPSELHVLNARSSPLSDGS